MTQRGPEAAGVPDPGVAAAVACAGAGRAHGRRGPGDRQHGAADHTGQVCLCLCQSLINSNAAMN